MAPEVLRRELTTPGDLWSVGCVMFEMLAKETPFTGFDQTELLRNVENGKCAPMPPGVRISEACASLLRGLLRQDQLQRLSFQEFFASRFVTRGRAVLDSEGFLEYGNIIKEKSHGDHRASSSSLESLHTSTESNGMSTNVVDGGVRTRAKKNGATLHEVSKDGTPRSGIRSSIGGRGDGAEQNEFKNNPPAPATMTTSSSASLPFPSGGRSNKPSAQSKTQSDSDDFVLIDTTTSKKQVIFKQVSGKDQALSSAKQGHHQQQPQQQAATNYLCFSTIGSLVQQHN